MAIEISVSILIEKLKNLLSEKEMIDSKLRAQVSSSMEEWERLPRLLKDAEKEEDSKVMKLLLNVYFVDDIIDNVLLKSSLKTGYPFSFLVPSRNQSILSQNIEKLFTNVTDFCSSSKLPLEQPENEPTEPKFEVGEPSNRQWQRISSFMEESEAIVGLIDQRDDLVQLVVSSRLSPFLISVVGEGGSGKTTLVKSMYDSVEVKQHFVCCAWVYVSEKFEVRDVLTGILRQVTVVKDEEKLPLESLLKRVRDFFLWKKYLIVLDDIPSPDVWSTIKYAFPNSARAARRVILTLPKIEVARAIDPRISLFQIRRMNHEESWALFLKKVRTAEDNSIRSLKENILSKCDGLPLAIVALAGLLSTRPPNQWSRLIDQATVGADQSSSSSNILAAGFRDLLPSLKSCLLYMSLFPKSREIKLRRLFGLWLAEGLTTPIVGESSKSIKKEDLAKSYFEKLVSRNMIEVVKWRLDGSPKTCYLSPTLHEALFHIAGKMGFFHVHPLTSKDTQQFNVRRIAEYLDINTYLSSDPTIQDLRSYISFNSRKGDTPAGGVDKLLRKIIAKRGFGLLTVLDLENVHRPSLSETLGKLLQLKYLGLRCTFLDSVPKCIGKLPCLETLDVKHTNITTLPISIWKVKKLRHLYMNEIHFDMSMQNPSAGGCLPDLQTLSGLLIGNNSSVIKLLEGLTGLRKLGLTCYKASLEKIIQWLPTLKNLESLKLRSINELHQPSDLNLITLKENAKLQELYLLGKLPKNFAVHQLPQNLRNFTLSVSKLHEDPMPILGKLNNLHILRFFAHSYLGKEMDCRKGFPELRVLKLWMLEELEEWTVEEGSMPKLRKVEIRCCIQLKQHRGLQLLASLKKLTLTAMPEDFVAEVKANLSQNIKIKTKN
ncbi:disease resistance protein RPP13 [Ricinus communis]|uniref:disease resistance protein RPP13 n=1 Tax=Ricinus communis TaxID=3988 RepID=UPI00201ADA5F|nr:disease resistance protein RPP13 [Ricinus communis]